MDVTTRLSRRDGRLVSKCIIRAWRSVVCERILGCTLQGLADVIYGVHGGKRAANRSVMSQGVDASISDAVATKRMCQWAAHAEKRRRRRRLGERWEVWVAWSRRRSQGE
jgi:hypothetical protein